MAKKIKPKEEKKVLEIPSILFLDKENISQDLNKVLDETDYWSNSNRSGTSWIISHRGVEKLAKLAGIKPQINTRFEMEVEPTYSNAMTNQFVAKMTCEAKDLTFDTKCIHGSDCEFFSSGEASRLNTGARGGSYMRIMAEKRAYDRGVLRHLGLNDGVNIYSEEEAESFAAESDKSKPLDDVIEKHAVLLNKILNSRTSVDLIVIGKEINAAKADYTKEELDYIRTIWSRRNGELNTEF